MPNAIETSLSQWFAMQLAALAFLAKLSADLRRAAWKDKPNENEAARINRRLSQMQALVPTVPEIRYLLARASC